MNENRQNLTPFFSELKNYADSNVTPLDIPGHKLGRIPGEMREALGENIFRYDANAPKGLDNLNRPRGVIKEAQELMAEAYGADRAYFLTSGTTQGILAMIMSVCKAKEKIILPRNIHKSVVSALILSGAIPIFLPANIDPNLGISNGIRIEDLKVAIDENPEAKGVFVINPTYFGVASDIKEIVRLAHEHNMLVLADEAHGSHLGFSDELPLSAMQAGADLSASSLHKTIGSLTQSSVLLAKGNRVNYNQIRVTLNMLQSTSPSSLLMASLDVARKYIYFHGKEDLSNVLRIHNYAKEILEKIPGIEVVSKEYFQQTSNFNYDETKLLIKINDLGKPGYWIYNELRDKYSIQLELSETYVILVVLTIASKKEDIDKLAYALKDISDKYYDGAKKLPYKKFKYSFPEMSVRPREAFHAPKKFVLIEDALNEISGESIMVYPPGIPLVIPGEIIDQDIIDMLDFYINNGFLILTEQEDDTIKVIDKENWTNRSDDDEF